MMCELMEGGRLWSAHGGTLREVVIASVRVEAGTGIQTVRTAGLDSFEVIFGRDEHSPRLGTGELWSTSAAHAVHVERLRLEELIRRLARAVAELGRIASPGPTKARATKRPTYVAGPYGDPDPRIRLWHTKRAAAIGLVLQRQGLLPIVVHTSIEFGAFGRDDHPQEREEGQRSTLDLLDLVIGQGGEIMPLATDEGTWSSGTEREIRRACELERAARNAPDSDVWGTFESYDPTRWTWATWRAEFEKVGLLELWASLQERPPEDLWARLRRAIDKATKEDGWMPITVIPDPITIEEVAERLGEPLAHLAPYQTHEDDPERPGELRPAVWWAVWRWEEDALRRLKATPIRWTDDEGHEHALAGTTREDALREAQLQIEAGRFEPQDEPEEEP